MTKKREHKFCDHFGQLFGWRSHVLCGIRFCMSKFTLNDICYMCSLGCVLLALVQCDFGFYFRCEIAVSMHNHIFVPVIFQVFVIQLATYLSCYFLCKPFFLRPFAPLISCRSVSSSCRPLLWLDYFGAFVTFQSTRITNKKYPKESLATIQALCTQSFN